MAAVGSRSDLMRSQCCRRREDRAKNGPLESKKGLLSIEDYTFKKSTCERYDLRWKNNGWATFTIDENGGLFNCQSDFGDYNYSWPKHGRESFKHFLIEITRSPEYLLGKVAKEDCFDLDKALKQWKPRIIEMRKDREITADQAREAWDFIEGLDNSSSVDYLQSEIYSNSCDICYIRRTLV